MASSKTSPKQTHSYSHIRKTPIHTCVAHGFIRISVILNRAIKVGKNWGISCLQPMSLHDTEFTRGDILTGTFLHYQNFQLKTNKSSHLNFNGIYVQPITSRYLCPRAHLHQLWESPSSNGSKLMFQSVIHTSASSKNAVTPSKSH